MSKGVKLRGELTAKKIETFVNQSIESVLYPRTPFEIKKNYLIRTVTMIDIGRVKAIIGSFLVLENASWIGNTGRFHECLKKTDIFEEIEPFHQDAILNLNSIIDATPWPYELPVAAK